MLRLSGGFFFVLGGAGASARAAQSARAALAPSPPSPFAAAPVALQHAGHAGVPRGRAPRRAAARARGQRAAEPRHGVGARRRRLRSVARGARFRGEGWWSGGGGKGASVAGAPRYCRALAMKLRARWCWGSARAQSGGGGGAGSSAASRRSVSRLRSAFFPRPTLKHPRGQLAGATACALARGQVGVERACWALALQGRNSAHAHAALRTLCLRLPRAATRAPWQLLDAPV